MIQNKKPAYWISVRDAFWCFLTGENNLARQYENTVTRMPVIKTIGLTKAVAAGDIYSSGIIYDTIARTQGAEIALGAVALPKEILDRAAGAVVNGGFTFDNVSDIGAEFAFGYYLEESDGNYVYYWHPRCKLTASDESPETATDSAPDPNRDFTIKALPTAEGIWRVRYATKGVEPPLTVEEFFGFVRYTALPQLSEVTISDPAVDTACTVTAVYADGASEPAGAVKEYEWYIKNGEEFVSAGTGETYTPAAEDTGKSLKVRALVTGGALGMVESEPKTIG